MTEKGDNMTFDDNNKKRGYRPAQPLLMSILLLITVVVFLQVLHLKIQSREDPGKEEFPQMKYNALTPEEEQVIVRKGTEHPFSGKYYDYKAEGFYLCKRCDAALFRSADKFDSGCGWPSFDDEIEGAVKEVRDADGSRREILCARCDGHMGHVFRGEQFTAKNLRHCVNSISMNFVAMDKTARGIFASGCFWGTEYHLKKARGVLSTTVGYTGGHKKNPTYKEVCSGSTGHAEAVEVLFDPERISFEGLVKIFFESHDPTQMNRQGPDVGEQYRSEIFYLNEEQKETALRVMNILKDKGYRLATRLSKAGAFWKGEEYHQDYYRKNNGSPYCHVFTKRF